MKKQWLYISIGLGGVVSMGSLLFLIGRLLKKKETNSDQVSEALSQVNWHIFDSPDLVGSGECMNPELVKMLIVLQEQTGYPILENINSGARSPSHNAKVGGVRNSAHRMPTCRAVDIHVPNENVKRALAYAARDIGFKRMGIGRNFIHLDNDPSKKQYVAWGYPAGTRPAINPFLNV